MVDGVVSLTDRLITVLQLRQWCEAGQVFAVIDACGAPSVPPRMNELGEHRAVSLYRGRAEEELWGIAPYLVQLDPGTLDWLAETLWATPWGIFALADRELEEVRTHFRRFLVVESPGGEDWYFRFYDPRVLPRFLDASTEAERSDLFGPLRALGVTDPETYGIRLFFNAPAAPAPAARPGTVRVVRR